jgi:hypothetical protein
MKKIFFFLILFMFSSCAAGQKSRDYNYLDKDRRAMNYMGKAIDKCIRWIEEKNKSNPDPLVLSDRPIKFQRYLKSALKADPEILGYSNIYKGKTYQQWVSDCEKK